MVGYCRQSRLVYTNITHIALNNKHTLCIKVAHTNYLTSSLNIYVGKTLVPNFSVPSNHPSIDGKPYYNSSLSLNESIDPTSISL